MSAVTHPAPAEPVCAADSTATAVCRDSTPVSDPCAAPACATPGPFHIPMRLQRLGKSCWTVWFDTRHYNFVLAEFPKTKAYIEGRSHGSVIVLFYDLQHGVICLGENPCLESESLSELSLLDALDEIEQTLLLRCQENPDYHRNYFMRYGSYASSEIELAPRGRLGRELGALLTANH